MQDASGSSGEGKVLHRGLLGPQDAKFAAMGEEYVAVGLVRFTVLSFRLKSEIPMAFGFQNSDGF
jgi:hypothetical protein